MYWFIKSIKLTCFLPQNFFKQEIPHLKISPILLHIIGERRIIIN